MEDSKNILQKGQTYTLNTLQHKKDHNRAHTVSINSNVIILCTHAQYCNCCYFGHTLHCINFRYKKNKHCAALFIDLSKAFDTV